MKNAIAAITIPFFFLIVLHLLNKMICWVFECQFETLLSGGIVFTFITAAIFTAVFYLCVFEWLNEKKIILTH